MSCVRYNNSVKERKRNPKSKEHVRNLRLKREKRNLRAVIDALQDALIRQSKG